MSTETKKLYQPTVELFRYSLWRGKWIQHRLYPSTLVFESWGEAEMYKSQFIEGLKRRGVKLKSGNFEVHNSEIFIN